MENHFKLQRLGLKPTGYDQKNLKLLDESIVNRIPFSRNFRTCREFEEAKVKLLEADINGVEIPEDLFNKVKSTMEELGLLE